MHYQHMHIGKFSKILIENLYDKIHVQCCCNEVFCYIMNKSHWLSLFKSKHGTKIRKAKTQRYGSAHEGQQLTVQLNDYLTCTE